jgi:hypothetical protein
MKIKYFVYLLLAIILLLVFAMPEINARKNRANANEVRKGMTTEEVMRIMGEPKVKGLPFASLMEADSTYQYQAPFASSDGIYISFDQSGRVIHIANE